MSNSSMPEFGKSSKARAEEEDQKSFGPPVFSDDPFASTPTPNTIQTFRDHQINGEQFNTSDDTPTISDIAAAPYMPKEEPADLPESPQPIVSSRKKSRRENSAEKPADNPPVSKPKKSRKFSFKKPARKVQQAAMPSVSPTDAGPNLKTICIILGASALIASAVAVWALINRGSTSTNVNPSSITTAEGSLAAKTLGFYPKKIANSSDGYEYSLAANKYDKSGNKVLDVAVSADGNSVSINVYWNYVRDYYGVVTGKNEKETFTLEYDTPISDLTIASSSKSQSGDAILVLLSNGTIQYIPILMSLQSKSFQTSGQLNGIANVVKFYQIAITDKGITSDGFTTVIAQKNDGTLFDLQYLLKSATGQNK